MEARVHVALEFASPGVVENKQGVWMSAVLTDHRMFGRLIDHRLEALTEIV
jgi:hypothetical protein